jgi:RpiR family carbohydrate utilization transcriptional regulator
MRQAQPMSLSARLGLLSPKRQQIIKPALEQPREFVLLSIRDLAKRLKTDPATMVRIVRGMRFGSYRDFQHYLHELSIAHATSLDTMRPTVRGVTVPAQVQASFDQDLKNLTEFTRTCDASRIIALAGRLHTARRIVLLAGDLAINLVKFLEHQLNVLGLPISCAVSAGEIVHKSRHLGPKDVAIGVTFRRGLRQTVEGLRQARENGAYCVVVTDSLLAPICQFANECFITIVETPSYGASYVAPIALFDSLVVACANYRRPATLAIVKKMAEEQRYGFRWYEAK